MVHWVVEPLGGAVLASAVGWEAGLPTSFALVGVSPNPVRGGAAVVRLDLPAAAEVALRVFDVLGREVLAVPERPVEAGAAREVALDAGALPPGVYVYRAEVRHGGEVERYAGRFTLAR